MHDTLSATLACSKHTWNPSALAGVMSYFLIIFLSYQIIFRSSKRRTSNPHHSVSFWLRNDHVLSVAITVCCKRDTRFLHIATQCHIPWAGLAWFSIWTIVAFWTWWPRNPWRTSWSNEPADVKIRFVRDEYSLSCYSFQLCDLVRVFQIASLKLRDHVVFPSNCHTQSAHVFSQFFDNLPQFLRWSRSFGIRGRTRHNLLLAIVARRKWKHS